MQKLNLNRKGKCPPAFVPWSGEEDALLITCFGKMSTVQMAPLFPSRTIGAIKFRMGTVRDTNRLETLVRPYSRSDLAFIRNHAGTMTIQQVADAMGRTYYSVNATAKRHKISFLKLGDNNPLTKHSDETVELIRALRSDEGGEPLTFREIGEKFDISGGVAWSICNRRHTKDDVVFLSLTR